MTDDERPRDSDDGDASRTDEPLGDLAEEVRERTGAESADRSDPPRREGPLADVAAAVDERRERKRERGRDAYDAFESVEVGDIDGEKLWEQLAESDDRDETGGVGAAGGAGTGGGTGAVGETGASGNFGALGDAGASAGPETAGGDDAGTVSPEEPEAAGADWDAAGTGLGAPDVRTIPKETCHGCPHLGDPPELACTHEGTEILAMPDTDHFRVADCPIVTDDEDLDIDIGPDDDGGGGGVPEAGDSDAGALDGEDAESFDGRETLGGDGDGTSDEGGDRSGSGGLVDFDALDDEGT